jgi:lysophospholipase L1-like esterase
VKAVNRQLFVPAALIGTAGVVSSIGLGGHGGQSVVVAGDSLTAAADKQIGLVLTADGWRPLVDGRSGSSITNRNAVFDWSARINTFVAVHPAVVVIELGTNDCGNCGDDLDAAIDRLLTPLRHVARVIWLTAQTDVDVTTDPGRVNEALRKATVRWPNLEILDMAHHFAGHPEWHTGDGVHFNEAGSTELATFLRQGIDAPASLVGILSAAV